MKAEAEPEQTEGVLYATGFQRFVLRLHEEQAPEYQYSRIYVI